MIGAVVIAERGRRRGWVRKGCCRSRAERGARRESRLRRQRGVARCRNSDTRSFEARTWASMGRTDGAERRGVQVAHHNEC